MPPAPWVLISPSGIPHVVRDKNEVATLPSLSTEIAEHQLNYIRMLIGLLVAKKDAADLPLHKCHWQLRARVPCIRCDETGEYVFIVGGEASFFKKLTHLHHPAMVSFDWGRLTTFLNRGGKIWSTAAGGLKVEVDFYRPKNSPFKWRLVVPPTDVLLARFPAPEVCSGR